MVVPSVMAAARSAVADGVPSVSVSVTLLLARLVSVVPAGGLTVTVLVSRPDAFGSIVPLSVMLTLWPLARLSPLHTPVPML
jgi:hypothetical protein